MLIPTPRSTNALIAGGCAALIAVALGLQMMLELHPCPLCITQRIFVIVVGVIALLAALHNPARTGRRVYAACTVLAALIGGGVSARHVYIQHLPADQVPACGPGLEYMFAQFPLLQALKLLLAGDGNCAVVDWTFLGMSIAELTLIAFIGLATISAFQLLRR